MTRAMGYAWYKGPLSDIWDYGIKLSSVLMPYASEEEQIETVVHEACHIATFLVGEKGHGRLWKQYMRQCGYVPKRCHTYSYGHIAKCECRTFAISPKKFKRSPVRHCTNCFKTLKYTGEFGVINNVS